MRTDERKGVESSTIRNKYVRALEGDIELGNPKEIAQALHMISTSGNPEAIFASKPVPPELQEAYTQARIAKDRYWSMLAAWVDDLDPGREKRPILRQVKGEERRKASRLMGRLS